MAPEMADRHLFWRPVSRFNEAGARWPRKYHGMALTVLKIAPLQ